MRLQTSRDSVRCRRKWIQQSDSGIGLALTLPWCPAVIPLPLASGKVSGNLKNVANLDFEGNVSSIEGLLVTDSPGGFKIDINLKTLFDIGHCLIWIWRNAGIRNGLSRSRKVRSWHEKCSQGHPFAYVVRHLSIWLRIELTCFKCFYFSIDLGLPWEQPRFKSAFAEEHCCDAHRHRNSRRLAYHLQIPAGYPGVPNSDWWTANCDSATFRYRFI